MGRVLEAHAEAAAPPTAAAHPQGGGVLEAPGKAAAPPPGPPPLDVAVEVAAGGWAGHAVAQVVGGEVDAPAHLDARAHAAGGDPQDVRQRRRGRPPDVDA